MILHNLSDLQVEYIDETLANQRRHAMKRKKIKREKFKL